MEGCSPSNSDGLILLPTGTPTPMLVKTSVKEELCFKSSRIIAFTRLVGLVDDFVSGKNRIQLVRSIN